MTTLSSPRPFPAFKPTLEGMDPDPELQPTLEHRLAAYVRAVAALLVVPTEGTSSEVSDTATAYVGLARHHPRYPGRDLMLVWSEHHGWAVFVETDPDEIPILMDWFGSDLVPAPEAIARFVTEVIADVRSTRHPTVPQATGMAANPRRDLAQRLAPYTSDHSGHCAAEPPPQHAA